MGYPGEKVPRAGGARREKGKKERKEGRRKGGEGVSTEKATGR
jgi:hypothetical protein